MPLLSNFTGGNQMVNADIRADFSTRRFERLRFDLTGKTGVPLASLADNPDRLDRAQAKVLAMALF